MNVEIAMGALSDIAVRWVILGKFLVSGGFLLRVSETTAFIKLPFRHPAGLFVTADVILSFFLGIHTRGDY